MVNKEVLAIKYWLARKILLLAFNSCIINKSICAHPKTVQVKNCESDEAADEFGSADDSENLQAPTATDML